MELEFLPFFITPVDTVHLNFKPERSSKPDKKAEHTYLPPMNMSLGIKSTCPEASLNMAPASVHSTVDFFT